MRTTGRGQAAAAEPLYERLSRALAQGIARGEWAPGGRLPTERALAQRFRCSRATISKAIAKLQSRGLVRSRQGAGTFVTSEEGPPPAWFDASVLGCPPDVRELLQFRALLEKEAARLAAGRASSATLQVLRSSLFRMRTALVHADRDAFVRADVMFHLALVQASGNRLFTSVYGRIQELLQRQMRAGTACPGSMQRAVAAHERIAAAVRRRAGDEAVAAVVLHLHDAAEEMRAVAAAARAREPAAPAAAAPLRRSARGGGGA